jgi:hypothetical protein
VRRQQQRAQLLTLARVRRVPQRLRRAAHAALERCGRLEPEARHQSRSAQRAHGVLGEARLGVAHGAQQSLGQVAAPVVGVDQLARAGVVGHGVQREVPVREFVLDARAEVRARDVHGPARGRHGDDASGAAGDHRARKLRQYVPGGGKADHLEVAHGLAGQQRAHARPHQEGRLPHALQGRHRGVHQGRNGFECDGQGRGGAGGHPVQCTARAGR